MGQEYFEKGHLNPLPIFDTGMLQSEYARLTVSGAKQMEKKIIKAGYKDFNFAVGREDWYFFLKCPPGTGEHLWYMPVSRDTLRFIRHDHIEDNNA